MYVDRFGGQFILDALAGQLVPYGAPLVRHGGGVIFGERLCVLVDPEGG
jgi:hypothetical protein